MKYPWTVSFTATPTIWSGRKRRWAPPALWKWVMGSSVMGLPVVHLIVRWVFNKTDKQFRRWR